MMTKIFMAMHGNKRSPNPDFETSISSKIGAKFLTIRKLRLSLETNEVWRDYEHISQCNSPPI